MGQLSPERIGKVTASRVSDVMAKGKGNEPSRTRATYMAELICERLTGLQYEGFQSADMARGNDVEAEAKSAYAFMSNVVIHEGEFAGHPIITSFGASPDTMVEADGLAEFKCPKTGTHIDTLLTGTIAREYLFQMQAQMACTGRKYCDFVSFDPRMPVDMQLFIKRVNRDDVFIAQMENEIVSFLSELEAKINALNAQYASKAA